MSRETTWRDLCVQADPELFKPGEQRFVEEYSFTTPQGEPKNATAKTYADGRRIFKGDYQRRGPYAE